MDILDQWHEILEKILQYYADLPYRYGDISSYVGVSRDPPDGTLCDRHV